MNVSANLKHQSLYSFLTSQSILAQFWHNQNILRYRTPPPSLENSNDFMTGCQLPTKPDVGPRPFPLS